MAKKIISLITGILFSISLVAVGYFTLLLAVALAFGNKDGIFGFLPFVLWASALVSLVGSCLVFKFPKVTGIILSIPTAIVLATFIMVLASGIPVGFGAMLVYIVPLVLAAASIVLAFLSKPSVATPYVVGPVQNVAAQPQAQVQPQPQAQTAQVQTTAQGININVNLKGTTPAQAPKTKTCEYCGATVDAGDKKCPGCGGKLV